MPFGALLSDSDTCSTWDSDREVADEMHSQACQENGACEKRRRVRKGSVAVAHCVGTAAVAGTAVHSKNSCPRTAPDVITISSDSDSEPSKSQMVVGRKRKRRASNNSLASLSSTADTDSDVILVSETELEKSLIEVCNVSQDQTSEPSACAEALNGFLAKCRPVCQAATRTGRARPVSVELLNSLPGSNNRFKRIKLDPDEDPSLWRVDTADCVTRNKARRYFGGQKLVVCLNCKQFTDHVVSRCPKPKPPLTCYVCALAGHHGNSCRSVICGKCFKKGHVSANCTSAPFRAACSVCGCSGHSSSVCPDHWRKFCSTTSPTESDPEPSVKRKARASCSSCCSNSHFAFECPNRQSDMFPISCPFIGGKVCKTSFSRNMAATSTLVRLKQRLHLQAPSHLNG